MKLTPKAPKPRNPLVAPSRRRSAGAHRARSHRQAGERTLREEIDRWHKSP